MTPTTLNINGQIKPVIKNINEPTNNIGNSILPIRLSIEIGNNIAGKPNPRAIFVKFPPKTLAIAISLYPRNIAKQTETHSGAAVVREITVIPINKGLTHNFEDKQAPPSHNNLAPNDNNTNPMTIKNTRKTNSTYELQSKLFNQNCNFYFH